MKLRYKLLISLGIIMLVGNLMYIFTWTRDMFKGYLIGNIIGMITIGIVLWLFKKK